MTKFPWKLKITVDYEPTHFKYLLTYTIFHIWFQLTGHLFLLKTTHVTDKAILLNWYSNLEHFVCSRRLLQIVQNCPNMLPLRPQDLWRHFMAIINTSLLAILRIVLWMLFHGSKDNMSITVIIAQFMFANFFGFYFLSFRIFCDQGQEGILDCEKTNL